jgi:hypothetical protein
MTADPMVRDVIQISSNRRFKFQKRCQLLIATSIYDEKRLLAILEIARVLVRFNQLAGRIVNANYSGVRATEKVRVVNGVSYSIFAAQQRAPKWKRIRD